MPASPHRARLLEMLYALADNPKTPAKIKMQALEKIAELALGHRRKKDGRKPGVLG